MFLGPRGAKIEGGEMGRIIAVVVGAILGIVITKAWDWWIQKRLIHAHRNALAREIEICREHSQTYQQDGIQAPLYRLPTQFYTSSLPALIANRALHNDEVDALIRFYNQAETMNRGLEQINAARQIDSVTFTNEHNRNMRKARELVAQYYPAARDAVATKPPGRVCAFLQTAKTSFAGPLRWLKKGSPE